MDLVKRITKTLIKYPETRDNDRLLTVKIWQDELPENNSLINFLDLYSKGELSSPDTIIRKRRLAQEKLPELRGESFDKRQKMLPKILKPTLNKKEIRVEIKQIIENMAGSLSI
jgi:hypothetical protein